MSYEVEKIGKTVSEVYIYVSINILECFKVYPTLYCRSGFDCEILLIANCEFFHNSQSKESQEKEYAINNILPAWQFAIIKIAIWLV